jgi:imidazolonepropionase-like amidohydrolase
MNNPQRKNLWMNLLLICGSFIFTSTTLAQGITPQNKTYHFINGQWFDGKNFRKQEFYSVDGKFTKKKPAKIDEVVDLKKGFVVPPFADAHSHKLNSDKELAKDEASFIAEGTMYVMTLTNGAINSVRNRLILNKPDKVDVLYANGGITRTGQHPAFPYERDASGIAQWWLPENTKIIQASHQEENNSYWFFDTIEDVDKKWNAYISSHPDIVKIYLLDVKNKSQSKESISAEVAEYVIKKAHAAGLRVAAHIETFDDLKLGVKIGVDVFAHMPHYNYFYRRTELAQPIFSNEELQAIRQRKIVLIPTLSLTEDYAIVRDASNNYQGKFDPVGFNEALSFQKKTLATLSQAGFTFATGSDRDGVGVEMNYWVKNKVFDAVFTLQTATVTTPQMMYPRRKIGALQEGYEASFLVLSGNPLENFENAKNITLRIKQGVLLNSNK